MVSYFYLPGSGIPGITFRGEDRTPGKRVAIKEYFPGHFAHHTGTEVRPMTERLRDDHLRLRQCFLEEAESPEDWLKAHPDLPTETDIRALMEPLLAGIRRSAADSPVPTS